MRAFLEKYGSTVFTIVLLAIIVSMLPFVTNTVTGRINQEVDAMTEDDISVSSIKPGLYNSDGILVKSWEDLISDGDIIVANGVFSLPKRAVYTEEADGDADSEEKECNKCEIFSQEGKLVIADDVTAIAEYSDYCYHTNVNITELQIPNSVTSLGEGMCFNWTNLEKVVLSENIDCIPANAFSGCTGLREIEIPQSVKTIGLQAFKGCGNLKSINIPEMVEAIGKSAFSNCESLKTVIIVSTQLKEISDSVFQNSGICYITIPESVEKIGKEAFYNCDSLTYLKIPNSVKNVETSTLQCCSRLQTIVLSDNLNEIDKNMLSGCNNLKYVYYSGKCYGFPWSGSKTAKLVKNFESTFIDDYTHKSPDGVTEKHTSDSGLCMECGKNIWSAGTYDKDGNLLQTWDELGIDIEKSAIMGGGIGEQINQDVSRIIVPKTVTYVGVSQFAHTDSLCEVILPDTIKSLGFESFSGCKGLTSIILPDSTSSIGTRIFYGCINLKIITIPKTIESIPYDAFYNCTSLTEILYTGTVNEWNNLKKNADWNYNCPEITVHCTDDSVIVPAYSK